MKFLTIILSLLLLPASLIASPVIRCGAEQMETYLPLLQHKRIALVVNHTSTVGKTHLLDTLCCRGVDIRLIFAPEHGFRGQADAGETIQNGKDQASGVPVLSLYGNHKKPQPQQLAQTDLVVFDIQDVGARFYTYISTLFYVMQACAENGKGLIVLDRPNPCDYTDGPILDKRFKSFVGMLPIPVLHGCTTGELAKMINGEKWLGKGKHCKLTVIPCKGWTHGKPYSLPVKPSPNLPNDLAIALYPSLCGFEGTSVSVGRGTVTPFQILGSPLLKHLVHSFRFRPEPLEGFDKNPLHKGKYCYGYRITAGSVQGFSLRFIIEWYKNYQQEKIEDQFFTRPHWFDLLMGTDQVRKDIISGLPEAEIRKKWKQNLASYRLMRKKYLLYSDYEIPR